MRSGLLIYKIDDYIKNKWFAEQFIKNGYKYNLDINLCFVEDLNLMIENGRLFVYRKGERIPQPDFIINRSRNSQVSLHFELMGCRVFNNSRVTEICNNKAKTHQIINSYGIKSVKTAIPFNEEHTILKYPVILKTNAGHGGTEVFKVHNRGELLDYYEQYKQGDFILQEICDNPGVDVRVFVMGGEIIGAVKRYSDTDFKSNFSLGGNAERYSLNQSQRSIVNKIGQILNFDFAGIDFLIDSNGEFLFNEIEDAVGTRTLYQQYDFDVVQMYLEYMAKQLNINKE